METSYIVVAVITSPLIALGVFGNSLSIAVWARGRSKNTSTSSLLIGLAVADNLTLLTAAVELWCVAVFQVFIRNVSKFLCKLTVTAVHLFPALSSWILVCITFERVLCLLIPHKVRGVCTQLRASVIVGVLAVILCVLYLPVCIGTELIDEPQDSNNTGNSSDNSDKELSGLGKCSLLVTPILFFDVSTFDWFDIFTMSLIPSALMVLGNMSILILLVRRKRKFQNNRLPSSGAIDRMSQVQNSVTARVIVLCVAFLVCTTPIKALNILTNLGVVVPTIDIILLLSMLVYVNNGINFILYCLVGTGFRQDLKNLLTRNHLHA